MQKNTKQASALLWALFISIFIVALFTMISTSVKESLQKTDDFSEEREKEILIQKLIADNTMQTYIFDENQYIQKQNPESFSFQNGETKEIRFSFFLSPVLVDLNITKGGPMWAHFVDIGASNESTFSGVVFTGSSFTGMTLPSASGGILYLKNLGGALDFEINTSEPFMLEETYYSLMKKIGGKWLLQKLIKKRNFFPGDYPGFPYESFGFEF